MQPSARAEHGQSLRAGGGHDRIDRLHLASALFTLRLQRAAVGAPDREGRGRPTASGAAAQGRQRTEESDGDGDPSGEEKRTLLHLLNYIGRRNNHTCDTIEEIIPLHGVEISLRAEGPVTSVRAVPEDQALPFARAEGRITFTLPTLHGYQMIEVT